MLQENGKQLLQAYAQRSFYKEILQIANNIYYFTGYGHSNATLVIGNQSCILIDTLDSDIRAQMLKRKIAAQLPTNL